MLRLLFLIVLLLTGCTERQHTPKVLAEWGRAGLVGIASRAAPVGLAVSPDGSRVVLAWPSRGGAAGDARIHLTVVGEGVGILLDDDLEPPIEYLGPVQVLLGREGSLDLVWTAGRDASAAVWWASLPSIQDLRSPVAGLVAQQLSSGGTGVEWSKVVALPSGEVLAFWSDSHGHLFCRRSGDDDARELLTAVERADVLADRTGDVHIVWSARDHLSRLVLRWGILAPETLALSQVRVVAEIALPARASPSSVEGPTISLDRRWAYISWTQRDRMRGTEPLSTLVLPLDRSSASAEPTMLQLDATFPPRPANPGDYQVANVSEAPANAGAGLVEAVQVLPVQYATRTRLQFQPTLLTWADGQLRGYQALTWTEHPSFNPVVAVDGEDDVYVAWVDSIGEAFHYPVYLASTAPGYRELWRRLTPRDIGVIGGDYASRIALGVTLLPLMAIWLILPFPLLFIALTRVDGYGLRGQRILLAALFTYWASKYLLTSQLLTYLPGSRALPEAIAELLVFLLPVLLLACSIALWWMGTYLKRRREFSAMSAFLAILAVDMVLSLGIYGIGRFE